MKLLITISLFMFASCATPPQTKTNNKQPTTSQTATPTSEIKPVEVTATVLMQSYLDNEYKADQTYTGKMLLVSGTVEKVKKGVFDERYYIALKTSNAILNVCIYPKDESVMEEIKPNQKLTALGYCEGNKGGVVISDAELK